VHFNYQRRFSFPLGMMAINTNTTNQSLASKKILMVFFRLATVGLSCCRVVVQSHTTTTVLYYQHTVGISVLCTCTTGVCVQCTDRPFPKTSGGEFPAL
jgi:hypothetical protein